MQNITFQEIYTGNIKKYAKFWEVNNYAFLWHELFVFSVYKNRLIENILGVQEENLLCICKDGNYSFYLKKTEVEKNKKQILEFFTSSSYEKLTQSIKQILDEAEGFSWDIELTDWKDNFKLLSNKHTEAAALYFCTEAYYVDCIYEHLIDSGYKKENILQHLVLFKMPKFVEEQLEWYDLIIKEHDERDMNRLIENHCNKWKYIIAQNRMNPYTITQLRLRLEKDRENIDAVKQAYQDVTERYSAEYVNKKTYDSKNIFGEENSLLINRLSEISYLRLELRRVWMKTGYLIRTLLQKKFPGNESIFERSVDEILNENFNDCDDRKSFVYHTDQQNSFLFYNNTQEQFIEDNKVRGKIGFGIDVCGHAYVLEDNQCLSDALKFVNKDTILVLSQLCPEHVPLLGICKGIVVDEGGVAGHASIIAREMRKSAIIGTINGTKRIKNNEHIYLNIGLNLAERV